MKSMLGLVAALLLGGAFATPAHAFGWGYCGPVCPPVCYVTYQYQIVNSHRPEWRAEKVPVMIQKVTYRPETSNVNVQVLVPRMFDEKIRTSFYVPVTRVVERPVTTCVMVPMVSVNPWTGCCYMTCCPQWVVQNVACTVCEYQLQTRDEVVRVCRMVPEMRVVEQVRWIPQVTQEPSWTVRYHCVMVPCQVTVCVPVYSWYCP